MTAVISPTPALYFPNTNNTGAPAAGFKLFTYVAGSSTKQNTWTDSTQATINANPLPLDANGFAAASAGSQVWLDPTLVYKFVWAPANDTDPPSSPIRTIDNIRGPLDLATLTQAVIGSVLYPRTTAEITAAVTPVSYAYPPYDFRRYGAVDDGSTNNTSTITGVLSAFSSSSFVGKFYAAPNVKFNAATVFAALPVRAYLEDESGVDSWNTSGSRARVVGYGEKGDSTSVVDLTQQMLSGHNAGYCLNNTGSAGSSSGLTGVASLIWGRGYLSKKAGEEGIRQLARTEFLRGEATKWWWVLRRNVPWAAQNWEYWYTATSYAAGAYVLDNTGSRLYTTAAGGTTGSTNPNWTSGSASDGGVTWTYVTSNIDTSLFVSNENGELATNTSPVAGTALYLKANSDSTGAADVLIEATGTSKSTSVRQRPTDGGGAVTTIPYHLGDATNGLRLVDANAVVLYKATTAGGLQLGVHGHVEVTATNADTTPSVAGCSRLIVSNTGATNITVLDDGLATQEVELFFTNGNTTLVHNAGTFVLKGGVNTTPAANSIVVMTKYSGSSAWFEKSRNY